MKRKWLAISNLTWGIWRILTRTLESLKHFHFNMLLLGKVYMVWAKKLQRSYLSWNWRGIQNLERNRHVTSKLTEGIWQILTWALKSLRNLHVLSKVYIVWAKRYRPVTVDETKEGYKILRGIDLSFQNWHKEFDKFWPENSKVWKIFTLIGSFWAKYILFKLRKYKYRGVIFDETEEGYKILRGIDLSFQNWHKEFDKFWPEH